MKNYQRLKGMVAATFTPFNTDGELNLPIISQYADQMATSQMAGVFVCGTTGESLSLTVEERKAVLEAWVKATKRRFKVIAHVGTNSIHEGVELAKHAQECGADAVGAMAPDLPFYYYNMPSMTGVSLSVADFLIEGKKVMSNLVGTKFTHNNLMEMKDCLALNNGEFEVLHGYDEILTAGLALGAVAGVGSTYNYCPSIYKGIFEAVENSDLATARILQQKSVDVVKVIIKYGGGVRGGKAIMRLIGIDCGDCRLPITPFSEEEYRNLKSDLESIHFF